MTAPRRPAGIRAILLDLGGCVWRGNELVPGARELLDGLAPRGVRRLFLSNNSTELVEGIVARLEALGIAAGPEDVVAPLGVIGAFVRERQGPCRVLVVGAAELAEAMRRGGHTVVPHAAYREAQAVVAGRDEAFTFQTLTAAARAVAKGAAFYVCNLDARLPVEGGEFVPGAGAIAEAIATAGGRRPVMLGKPEPHLFRAALDRLGLPPPAVAMLGDTLATDILGAKRVGMTTIYFTPAGPPPDLDPTPDLVLTALGDLLPML